MGIKQGSKREIFKKNSPDAAGGQNKKQKL